MYVYMYIYRKNFSFFKNFFNFPVPLIALQILCSFMYSLLFLKYRPKCIYAYNAYNVYVYIDIAYVYMYV